MGAFESASVAADTVAKPTDTPHEHRGVRPAPASEQGGGAALLACWEYVDPKGKNQGPFSLVQMQQWHTYGYFRGDVPMRCTLADRFVPLSELYPHPLVPFQSYPAQQCSARDGTTISGMQILPRPHAGQTQTQQRPSAGVAAATTAQGRGAKVAKGRGAKGASKAAAKQCPPGVVAAASAQGRGPKGASKAATKEAPAWTYDDEDWMPRDVSWLRDEHPGLDDDQLLEKAEELEMEDALEFAGECYGDSD